MGKQCQYCGANAEDTDVYCKTCGKPIEAAEDTQQTEQTVQDIQKFIHTQLQAKSGEIQARSAV